MASDEELAETEDEVAQRLPRWLGAFAIALVVTTVAAVVAWSVVWRPDADVWGDVKCRVEAARAWPRDDVRHRVVHARCIEQLP